MKAATKTATKTSKKVPSDRPKPVKQVPAVPVVAPGTAVPTVKPANEAKATPSVDGVAGKLSELKELVLLAKANATGDRSPQSYDAEMDALNKAVALAEELTA